MSDVTNEQDRIEKLVSECARLEADLVRNKSELAQLRAERGALMMVAKASKNRLDLWTLETFNELQQALAALPASVRKEMENG